MEPFIFGTVMFAAWISWGCYLYGGFDPLDWGN